MSPVGSGQRVGSVNGRVGQWSGRVRPVKPVNYNKPHFESSPRAGAARGVTYQPRFKFLNGGELDFNSAESLTAPPPTRTAVYGDKDDTVGIGTTPGTRCYVLGTVETFLKALPSAGIFTETTTKVNGTVSELIQSISTHDLVAPAFLIPFVFSIFCIFIGVFLAKKDDPSPGVTGLSLESFKDNSNSDYHNTNSAGIPDAEGNVHWNFQKESSRLLAFALVGLSFPAVTGIMAGSNRSAFLKDTQHSIPVGTLAATLTTTGLCLVFVLLFGAVATRDKLLTDRLLTDTIAWPFPAIIHIGIIPSTLGAVLQSLTGAPRLLAAISNDDILPVLNYFKVADGSEPYMATLFTSFICMGCVIIGNLDLIHHL
ncbi:Cation-chloride cotransporter 1 [Hibiscus syriacus]|uniref:Cation-chloride cotransporter 1 n=1 Tax=Hibiscus syriacus TaxID=106335 RepID=A0A6A2X7B6_HIBSY|nr:Cation-chloride cotransporter 1 [Hibiscus syriacus]